MIAFFTALKEERQAVRSSWGVTSAGSVQGVELEAAEGVVHLCSGMGAERMKRAVELAWKTFQPTVYVLVGFSVGLNQALEVGDLVYDERSTEALVGSGGCVGRVATCGILSKATQKRAFAEKHPGCPVADLETEAFLAAVPAEADRLVLRVVSDTADTDLPLNFGELTSERGFPDVRAIGWKVAARPHLLPALLRLGREAGTAVKTLSKELERQRSLLLSDQGMVD